MSVAFLFLAAALGANTPAPKGARDLAITPSNFLANPDNYLRKNAPLLIRFRVGSVGRESVHDVASGKTYERIILGTGCADARKHASFDVTLLPEAQAALMRLGITDFAKHFNGKEVEVRGPLSIIPTILFGSETEFAYYLDVKSLDQFRSVKEVK